MSKDTEIQLLHMSELPNGIKVAFENLYDMESQIADLMAQHVKPLALQRTKEWRRIKASANISRKVLALFYAAYKAERDSENTETQAEGERIRLELNRVYQACKVGEVMNFLSALDMIPVEERHHPANGKPSETAVVDGKASVKAPHAPPALPAPAKEKPEPVVKPDNDWSNAPNGSEAELTDAQKSGFDFNAGEKAGLAGKDIKQALLDAGFDGRSNRGKQLKRGWEAGMAAREKQLEAVSAAAPDSGQKEEVEVDAETIPAAEEVPVAEQPVAPTPSNVTSIEGGYQAKQGRDAGWAGKSADDNPYPKGSGASETWERNRQIGEREAGHGNNVEAITEATMSQESETQADEEQKPLVPEPVVAV